MTSMDDKRQSEMTVTNSETDLTKITCEILLDTKASLVNKKTMSMPIAELMTLGAGVASLVPSLNTVTRTVALDNQGLYRLANAGAGDVLKASKDGTFWGALKTPDNGSKMAKLQQADRVTFTEKTTPLPDPATMMMAVALYKIEKELGQIEKTQRDILRFLEIETEAVAEADLETLVGIMKNYKLIWDNERFVASNHKMVLDIQRTARKNMNAYQKKAGAALEKREILTAQRNVAVKLTELQRTFEYYRLSLYTFSLASFLEILLSGNFKEEYIASVQSEIRTHSETYRCCFEQCSVFLEKAIRSAIGVNVKKSMGKAGKALGKLIEGIPIVSNGPVDEFLQSSGEQLKENAAKTEKAVVNAFAAVGDPGTGLVLHQMDDMIQIYDHTAQVCFDDKNIYLIADE